MEITLEDGLGLLDPAALVKWPTPKKGKASKPTLASIRALDSLAELILQHLDQEVDSVGWDGAKSKVPLLAANVPSLRRLQYRTQGSDPASVEAEIPLADVWRGWQQNRTGKLRDKAGLELVRAFSI